MRLTTTGRQAVGAVVVAYAAAVLLGLPLLAAVAVALVLALLLGALVVARRPSLHVVRQLDHRRCRVGETVQAALVVTNTGTRPSPPTTVDEPAGDTVVRLAVPRLVPGETARLVYPVPTGRRAVLELGPATVRRDDPFGLVTWSQSLLTTDTFWVNPRTTRLPPLPSGRRRDLEGPASNSAMQGTSQFHALREYVPGDDRRHIHWRSSARNQKLMVAEHVDVTRPKATVVLDVEADHYDADRFEVAVEVAASILVSTVERGFPVRLLVTDGTRLEEEQRPDAHLLLDALSAVVPVSGVPIGATASALARDRSGSTLTVVTGDVSPADLAPLRPLTGRYDAVGVISVQAEATTERVRAGLPMVVVSDVAGVQRAWLRGVRS